MKISELIALLEKRKEEYGDVDVKVLDDRSEMLFNVNTYVDTDGVEAVLVIR